MLDNFVQNHSLDNNATDAEIVRAHSEWEQLGQSAERRQLDGGAGCRLTQYRWHLR